MNQRWLKLGPHMWRGVAALGLFAVIVAVTLSAEFGASAGFPPDQSITVGLGSALFNLGGPAWYGEGFLASLILIAVVLDAALESSLMLAKREEDR